MQLVTRFAKKQARKLHGRVKELWEKIYKETIAKWEEFEDLINFKTQLQDLLKDNVHWRRLKGQAKVKARRNAKDLVTKFALKIALEKLHGRVKKFWERI